MMLKCLYLAWLAPVFGDESCMIQVQNMEKVESKSPVEYTATWSSATRALVYEHYAGPRGGPPCGPPIKDQKMYFAGPGRCSIASANMDYLAHDGTIKHARKGEIIEMNCDDVYCPIPVIADCYMSPDICSKNEWCWVRQHEKWGAWAMGPLPNGTFGHTPAMEYCKEFIPAYEEALKIAQQENDMKKIIELNRSLEILCQAVLKPFPMPGGQFVVNVCRSGRNSRAAFSNRTCHQPSTTLWLHVICWTTRVLQWSVPWHVLQILLAQHPTSTCCQHLRAETTQRYLLLWAMVGLQRLSSSEDDATRIELPSHSGCNDLSSYAIPW